VMQNSRTVGTLDALFLGTPGALSKKPLRRTRGKPQQNGACVWLSIAQIQAAINPRSRLCPPRLWDQWDGVAQVSVACVDKATWVFAAFLRD
jgi:hypothetical protein